jgi:hypothetical protein
LIHTLIRFVVAVIPSIVHKSSQCVAFVKAAYGSLRVC